MLVAAMLLTPLGIAPSGAPSTSAAYAETLAQPGSSFRLLETTIDGIHAAMRSGQLSCRQLVQMYIDRIEAYNHQGPQLNAVQTVNPNAMAEADRLDAQLASSGMAGPLHCIPVLVKDQVETSDMPTTYGSALFQDFVPLRNATVVEKLKASGGIVLAKTTMGEFASGYAGTAFGFCRNPYAPTHNTSGSSCGTGNGVAANLGVLGIAEDTGGSIRGPAAFNNAVGLRPTLPLVSRFGMMPATPSRDTLGPLTRTVRDTAIFLDVLAGYDPNDPITAASVGNVPTSYTSFLDRDGLRGTRIGVIRELMANDTNPDAPDFFEVRATMDRALADMAAQGAVIVNEVPLPSLVPLMRRISGGSETEQATNRYLAEHPNSPVKTLAEIVLSEKVIPNRRTGLMGSIGRSTEDPAYLRELTTREELRTLILQVMADYQLDALVYATYDHLPTAIPSDIMTRTSGSGQPGSNRTLAPLLGYPSLAVPAGFSADGLPIGIELLGRPWSEGTLIKLGYAYEQATHHRQPPATTPDLQ
jgi:amidase